MVIGDTGLNAYIAYIILHDIDMITFKSDAERGMF